MLKICGIDEAGRGPIAGPLCVAAVVLPTDFPFEILNDSKKMSLKKRQVAEKLIKEKAIAYAVAWANRAEIDRINVLNATLNAMQRCYEKIRKKIGEVDLVLIDGNKKPSLNIPTEAIIKGDAVVYEIMAASILAKNERDRLMIALDALYPEYRYAKHKGYPTKEHLEICRKIGPSAIQRHSFKY